jgi:hypothetical protein
MIKKASKHDQQKPKAKKNFTPADQPDRKYSVIPKPASVKTNPDAKTSTATKNPSSDPVRTNVP